MGRQIATNLDLPASIVKVVAMICADYDRRKIAIQFKTDNPDVLNEYERLNGIIDTALSEIEVGIRRVILGDVILGRGYHFSPASPFIAKNTYYHRKGKLVYDIARGMKLV